MAETQAPPQPEPEVVKLPDPPSRPQDHKYFVVYGEWTIFQEQPTIATAENPNATGGVVARHVGANEVISVQPPVWLMAMSQLRTGYQLKWATGISKEMYEWYKTCDAMIKNAMEAAQAAEDGK